jgi:hypothetical protein
MGREIVGKFVLSASRVRQNVIGCKLVFWEFAAAQMASGISLVEHIGPLLRG